MVSSQFVKYSLYLYRKEVIIIFKRNSPSVAKHGYKIFGYLVRRIWGQRLEERKLIETVIAISLRTVTGEFEVSARDILSIRELTEKDKMERFEFD
jgi:hypothetical protein